jgi:putative lipoic acid-binding regulatory protein
MSNDVAGRMLGWSLGALAQPERGRIHDLVSFPCEFCFKAVGRVVDDVDDEEGAQGFVATLLERVARVLGRDVTDGEHTVRKSAQGTYESVTLTLWVTSGDEVYSIYAALGDDERVKYLL